jgi:two-component system, NarL family, nitrate/nitrite response regulator NarL
LSILQTCIFQSISTVLESIESDERDAQLLVVDDHPLYSEALVSMLRSALDIRVHSVASRSAAMQYVASEHLRLVIVDLSLPDSTPKETCEWLKSLTRSKRTLAISGTQSLQDAQHAINAGACGFVPKTSSAEQIIAAVQAALDGGRILPREWTQHVTRPQRGDIVADQIALTARQWEVLKLMTNGDSNKAIARDLGMAEKTVKVHVTAIFRQLQVGNRTQAALVAKSLL